MRLLLSILFVLCTSFCYAQNKSLGYGTASYGGVVKPKDGQKVSCHGTQGKCGSKTITCGGPSFKNLSFFYSITTDGRNAAYLDLSVPAFLSNDKIYTNKEGGYDEFAYTNGLGQVNEEAEIAVEYEISFGGGTYQKQHTLVMANGKDGQSFSTVSGSYFQNKKEIKGILVTFGDLLPKQVQNILTGPASSANVRITNAYVTRWHDDNKFDVCNKIACKGASSKDKEANNNSASSNSSSNKNSSSGSTTTKVSAYEQFRDGLDWHKIATTVPNDPDEGIYEHVKPMKAHELLQQTWRTLPYNIQLNTLYCSNVKYTQNSAEFNQNGKCTISYFYDDARYLNCNDIHYQKTRPDRTKYTYEFDMKDIDKIGYVIQDHPTPDNNVHKLYGLVFFSNNGNIKEITSGYNAGTKWVSKTDYIFLDECKGDDCGGLNNELYKRMNTFRYKIRNHEKERNEDPNFWETKQGADVNKTMNDFWEIGQKDKKKDSTTTTPNTPKPKDDFWK